MLKNKVISYMIIIIFFIVFSIFNIKEYYSFHIEKINIDKYNSDINKKIIGFDIENITEFEKIDLYNTPSIDLLNILVEKINSSKKNIYIEVYMFTETRLREALIKAKKRGVDVKVILEKDPYLAYNINDKTYNDFYKNNIDIVRSNTKNYSLNHSKMILIDDLSIISTGNLTYSTFTQNRDFFIFINDLQLNKNLIELFNYDFKGIKKSPYNESLILSPTYSREKLIKLLNSAENDIKIYMQYFSDDIINNELIKIKNEKGLNISVIIPDTAINDENTIKLINAGIKIKKIPKYKMHAKIILIDEKYIMIGSINFSQYSIDKNREIGIIIKNKNIISNFLNVFNNDFK